MELLREFWAQGPIGKHYSLQDWNSDGPSRSSAERNVSCAYKHDFYYGYIPWLGPLCVLVSFMFCENIKFKISGNCSNLMYFSCTVHLLTKKRYTESALLPPGCHSTLMWGTRNPSLLRCQHVNMSTRNDTPPIRTSPRHCNASYRLQIIAGVGLT